MGTESKTLKFVILRTLKNEDINSDLIMGQDLAENKYPYLFLIKEI